MNAEKVDFETVYLLMLAENAQDCATSVLLASSPAAQAEFAHNLRLFLKRLKTQIEVIEKTLEET